MAFKPALCRADQSSSFGHFSPPPQTSVTTTPNCPPLHVPHHARATHSAAQEYLISTTQRCAWGHLTKLLTYGTILV